MPDCHQVDDIVRVNDAIDQAIAGSVSLFGTQADLARILLPGLLGHDTRSPLQPFRSLRLIKRR
jgi:hypothetical protein